MIFSDKKGKTKLRSNYFKGRTVSKYLILFVKTIYPIIYLKQNNNIYVSLYAVFFTYIEKYHKKWLVLNGRDVNLWRKI